MNKTAIRNFAIWARNKLIADVSYQAGLVGVTKNGIAQALPQSTNDVEFYDIGTAEPYAVRGEAIRQRKSLVDTIRQKENGSDYQTAFSSVIEEVAYTWFNRLIAIRFMEVNDYLPAHVRVLSSESGKQEPDIVTTPFDAELFFAEGEKEKIIQQKNDNLLDEVFRILFIKQCRELSKILPRLFEGTNDYTELLLSLSYIDQDGVVSHLVNDIPEDDFNVDMGGQVEIIGWLYQYYNAELKDETFALLKNNVKVTKERIPSATQLFTPDWIVRYMVENSLGRLWVEGHPNNLLKSKWKYYLDEADQESSVIEGLEKIRLVYAKLNPEDIKVIDPCMGSGHILVYAFDVLMEIYESAGYTQRDAAKSILEHNLFGLDIDDRAAQLAYFAVMMKARQYNRRILDGVTDCNVYSIKESNNIDREALVKLGNDLRPVAERLLDAFVDAKEYGSIISVDVTLDELDALDKKLDDVDRMSDYGNLLDMVFAGILCTELEVLIKQARVMVQKYDAVITNPPYRAVTDCSEKLNQFAKIHYPDSKNDLATICMEKTLNMCKLFGLMAMINIPVWMFLSSFEDLRIKLLESDTFINMLHFGRGIFGSDFGTTAFVLLNNRIKRYRGHYRRLFEKQGAVDPIEVKEKWFFEEKGKYFTSQDAYMKIPGKPVVYWAGKKVIEAFEKGKALESVAPPKQGSTIGNNDKFLRLWFEVRPNGLKWFNCLKGGAYRKWYGDHSYIINWENNGAAIIAEGRQTIRNSSMLFKSGISWSRVTIGSSSFRIMPDGFFFESASGVCFPYDDSTYYVLGLLNSKIVQSIAEMLNPTATLQSGDLARIPVVIEEKKDIKIKQTVSSSIDIAKQDWDSFETSWDFMKHPLV